MRIVYDASGMNVCMYVYSGYVVLLLVLDGHPKINLFGLNYCVIVVRWRQNQLFQERLSYKSVKADATKSKGIMGRVG